MHGGTVCNSFDESRSHMCMNYLLSFPSCMKASAAPTFTHSLFVFQVKWRKEHSQSAYVNTNPTTRGNKRRLHNPKPRFFYAPAWLSTNLALRHTAALRYPTYRICSKIKSMQKIWLSPSGFAFGLISCEYTWSRVWRHTHAHNTPHLVAETRGVGWGVLTTELHFTSIGFKIHTVTTV